MMTYNIERKWNDPVKLKMGLSTPRRHEIMDRRTLSSVSNFSQNQKPLMKKDISHKASASFSPSQKRAPLKADHNVMKFSNQGTKYEMPSRSLNRAKSQSLTNLYNRNDSSSILDKFNLNTKTDKYKSSNDDMTISKKSEMLMNSAKLKLERLKLDYQNSSSNRFVQPFKKKVNTASPVRTVRSSSFTDDKTLNKLNRTNPADVPFPGILKNRRYSLDSKSSKRPVLPKEVSQENQEIECMSSRSLASPGVKNEKNCRSGICGLRNLGNTCFMNSILQCLSKDKTLRSYFCSNQYKRDATGKCRLAAAFGDFMSDVWSSGVRDVVSPSFLKMEIQKFAPRFAGAHQHDSQEFLRCLIEGVHDELNAVKRKPTFSYDDIDHIKDDNEKAAVVWNRYLAREQSIIQELFVGQLRSTLTCSTCNYASVTFDPFWDLSLPIPTKTLVNQVDIKECFKVFTQKEVLDGPEKPTCEKCKTRRRCTKWFLIERCPKVLVIHLKRFSGQRYRTKLSTNVSFPMHLDIGEYTVSSEPTYYQLFGVSNHVGSTQGGHYTAHCKHPDTGKWHLFNDSRVAPVSSKDIVSSAAYVLFYELIDNKNEN